MMDAPPSALRWRRSCSDISSGSTRTFPPGRIHARLWKSRLRGSSNWDHPKRSSRWRAFMRVSNAPLVDEQRRAAGLRGSGADLPSPRDALGRRSGLIVFYPPLEELEGAMRVGLNQLERGQRRFERLEVVAVLYLVQAVIGSESLCLDERLVRSRVSLDRNQRVQSPVHADQRTGDPAAVGDLPDLLAQPLSPRGGIVNSEGLEVTGARVVAAIQLLDVEALGHLPEVEPVERP